MDAILAGCAGLSGLVVGSFLNVVILRRGVGGLGGRSGCTKCGHELAWYDLVPVLSWIFLRGRCRYCGSRIAIQYPLVEIGTALLFLIIFAAPAPVAFVHRVAFCAIAAILVCITVYDLRHTIIPDSWAYTFAALAFLTMFALPSSSLSAPSSLWLSLFAGPIAAAPLFSLWAISRGQWMGFGDVKLALGMGWLLGPLAGFFAVFAGFVLGTIVLMPFLAAGRVVTHSSPYARYVPRLTMKSEVPFGPFLILATLIVWLSFLYGYDLPGMIGW